MKLYCTELPTHCSRIQHISWLPWSQFMCRSDFTGRVTDSPLCVWYINVIGQERSCVSTTRQMWLQMERNVFLSEVQWSEVITDMCWAIMFREKTWLLRRWKITTVSAKYPSWVAMLTCDYVPGLAKLQNLSFAQGWKHSHDVSGSTSPCSRLNHLNCNSFISLPFLHCTRKAQNSIVGHDAGYTEIFHDFLQSLKTPTRITV